MYLYAAGVADVDLMSGNQLVSSAKTLTESTVTTEVSSEDIRAGKGAKLFGRFFHTSKMSFKLTDAMFNMDYIAANIGSVKSIGGSTMNVETVTATTANSLTVVGTPVDFLGQGTIGWYTTPGSSDWTAITFTGQTATATGVTVNTAYCVKYFTSNSTLETITVDANIVPTEYTAVMNADLFLGEKPDDPTTGTKVGYVEIIVPRFQLNGAMELNLTMAGASNTPLNGEALATYDSNVTCDGGAYYAIINKVSNTANWYDGLLTLAVQDGNIQLDNTISSEAIVTYGVYKNAQPNIISPTLLTYTISPSTANFQMDTTQTNLVKTKAGVAAGDTCNVEITVTGSGLPSAIMAIQAVANVEYSA